MSGALVNFTVSALHVSQYHGRGPLHLPVVPLRIKRTVGTIWLARNNDIGPSTFPRSPLSPLLSACFLGSAITTSTTPYPEDAQHPQTELPRRKRACYERLPTTERRPKASLPLIRYPTTAYNIPQSWPLHLASPSPASQPSLNPTNSQPSPQPAAPRCATSSKPACKRTARLR